MIVRRTIGVAALLLGVAGAAAPSAFASGEQPGAPCSPMTDRISADGTLWCNGQSGMWMNKGLHGVAVGSPCDKLGNVTYTPPEDPVFCRQSGSGLTWQRQ